MNTLAKWMLVAAMTGMGSVSAQASTFQGQDANGAFDNSCGNTCVMYYDSTLNIEILGNWNIGSGPWSATAAAGSAQALAEAAGFDATGVTGWVLPSGDGGQPAGTLNQFLSIWNDVGGSIAGLQAEFKAVQYAGYWSSSVYSPGVSAWYFATFSGNPGHSDVIYYGDAVAVRPGEISAVPLPGAAWLLLSGLGGLGLLGKRRQQQLPV
jgi:hypothetical protein